MIQERKHWGRVWFQKTRTDGTSYDFPVRGRNRWALESLIRAGRRGCTSFSHPAPRWSAYVHRLRQFGIKIETSMEPHFGDYPGTHARYVLVDKLVRLK